MRISDWSSDVCSSDLANRRPRSVPRRGSTTGQRTSTRTGTRAARSPAPRPESSRRAFPALLAALVLGVAHQADLLDACQLQQCNRIHQRLIAGRGITADEDRLIRVLVEDGAASRLKVFLDHRSRPVIAGLDQGIGAVGRDLHNPRILALLQRLDRKTDV